MTNLVTVFTKDPQNRSDDLQVSDAREHFQKLLNDEWFERTVSLNSLSDKVGDVTSGELV